MANVVYFAWKEEQQNTRVMPRKCYTDHFLSGKEHVVDHA